MRPRGGAPLPEILVLVSSLVTVDVRFPALRQLVVGADGARRLLRIDTRLGLSADHLKLWTVHLHLEEQEERPGQEGDWAPGSWSPPRLQVTEISPTSHSEQPPLKIDISRLRQYGCRAIVELHHTKSFI